MDTRTNGIRIPAAAPVLRHRMSITPPSLSDPYPHAPRIVGTPDQLYVAVSGVYTDDSDPQPGEVRR